MSTPASSQVIDLIGEIYDCVVEPAGWQGMFERLTRHLRMINGSLAVNSLDGGRTSSSFHVTFGIPSDYLARVAEYDAAIVELWGGPDLVMTVPLEEPRRQSDLTVAMNRVANVNIMENAYYRDFLEPLGIVDAAGVLLSRSPRLAANAAFGRHRSDGPIEDQVLDDLRILAPHLRRATTIAGLLDTTMSQAYVFSAALDACPTAITVCDADMSIVHANARAEAMFSAGDPIRSQGGVLSAREPFVPQQLEAAVAMAGNDDAGGRRGLGVPVRRLDGSSMLVHVLPLSRHEWRPGFSTRGAAALFISEAATPMQWPSDALALIYALTPAETRVMELVVSGKGLPEVAAALGTSRHTVRTHLNRVFDKTGCHRQADLVRLAAGIQLPSGIAF